MYEYLLYFACVMQININSNHLISYHSYSHTFGILLRSNEFTKRYKRCDIIYYIADIICGVCFGIFNWLEIIWNWKTESIRPHSIIVIIIFAYLCVCVRLEWTFNWCFGYSQNMLAMFCYGFSFIFSFSFSLFLRWFIQFIWQWH